MAGCHRGAAGHGVCRRSHLASLPAARIIQAPRVCLGCRSAARVGEVSGPENSGEGGSRVLVPLQRGLCELVLVALPGDLHLPPAVPGSRVWPR